ncbi:class I SAM-dependent methyltransferase [Candidatus Korobacter versatilis]|uniref:class I SAM-dependent methyltransferase n=1 Tax=Candidatus Korobacter versatilis TaxID=658062 RepID=UPI00031B5C94|nr:class I SAM-dependent methyltransferase [Candidatus Koribacter versatilis]
MTKTPSLGRAGLAWYRGLLQRDGVLRGTAHALGSGWELALDYLPSRKRLRYGDIDYDFDHGVNTTWAAPTLSVRLREIFTRGQYQPSEPELFRRILDELKVNHSEFVFIDLGSGKGRTLLMAADYPFRKIIGAEIIPELHATAEQNITRYHSDSQKCFELEAWLGDAREFPYPPAPLVLYLFNPFPADILRDVLQQIHATFTQSPREIFVIYHNLVHEDVFRSMEFMRTILHTPQYAIYRLS